MTFIPVRILTIQSNCNRVRKLPVRPFDSWNKYIQKAVFNIFEHLNIQTQVVYPIHDKLTVF